jgi:hypothetical protein
LFLSLTRATGRGALEHVGDPDGRLLLRVVGGADAQVAEFADGAHRQRGGSRGLPFGEGVLEFAG